MKTHVVTLFIVLAACNGGVQIDGATQSAPAVPAPSKPSATVPKDYVLAPGGIYIHRSCLIQVEQGETILQNGDISRADGSIRAIAPCTQPRFDSNGVQLDVDPQVGSLKTFACNIHPGGGCGGSSGYGSDWWGWFQYGPNDAIRSTSGTWTVPGTPSSPSAEEILYIWNGLQSTYSGELVQPVLAYNAVSTLGSGVAWQWAIAAWYWTPSNVYHSAATIVHYGNTIGGNASWGAGGQWTQWMTINGGYSSASLTGYAQAGLNMALGGVIEVHYKPGAGNYGGDSNFGCWELPGTSYVEWTNISVGLSSGAHVTPTWTYYPNPGSPNPYLRVGYCNMTVYVGSNWGYLSYQNW